MIALNRGAEFIREHYQTIILVTVILALLLGLATTAPSKILQGYSQLLTFLMILFISFTITPRQFAAIVGQPLAVLAGLGLNFVYMPLLAWALARLLVQDAELAAFLVFAGFMMIFYKAKARQKTFSRPAEIGAGAGVGSVAGFLGGLLGISGGNFIVPVLNWLGLWMPRSPPGQLQWWWRSRPCLAFSVTLRSAGWIRSF